MSEQPHPRGRILVVEDQGIVATDIQRCLEDNGFEVTAIAASMDDAMREASQSRPDMVLMDIRIQGDVDGIEAADRLHQHFGLPIVYLTAHDDTDTMARAKRTEPMAFLLKPFKPAELTSTVEIALKRSWAEQEAREREQSFLSAMDSIGDAVLTTDAEGRVRFMNRAAENLIGWTQTLALGRYATDILRIVDERGGSGDVVNALLGTHCELGKSIPYCEYRIQRRDGTERWVTFKSASIAAADTSSIRVAVMQDVTERKQTEQALRRQADLLDQAQEPIFTWDIDGVITYWNLAAQALYGFSAREAVGRAASELMKTVTPCGAEAIEVMLRRDGRWSGELTRTAKDGKVIVIEGLLVIVEGVAGRTTVLETDRNITERKRAELEIRRLNRELEDRVSELTAVNQELESFNYSVSHDLRAPLRHMDAYSKILLDRHIPGVPEDARRSMERIREGARRMGRMVDELLELSRTSRREISRQMTGLGSLVEDVLDELKPEMQDREIEWRIGELPSCDCDPTLTRQIFANLLSNAVKFTRPRTPAVIEIGQTIKNRQPVFFVRDNGVGFSMKYADKLFGVFQRLHRREDFEGTGVGLVTVQRIVHKHGGGIWAEAELEKGATFYFTLQAPSRTGHPTPDVKATAVLEGES